MPHVNHPNFGWAIAPADLAPLQRYRLLEIYNGHPLVNNLGGGDRPGVEQVWDQLLTAGQRVYGIAVDDAHYFKRPWDPMAPRPGRGWVMVQAPRLEASALMTSLEEGAFYASTGVELEAYAADRAAITLRSGQGRHPLSNRARRSGRGGPRHRAGRGGSLFAGRPQGLRPRRRHRLQRRPGVGTAGVSRLVTRREQGTGNRERGTGNGEQGARTRYTAIVQLHVARLCLDCEEVHDEYRCPACASDQFSYLTRWVPGRDRSVRPRSKPAPPPEADVYRRLIHGEPPPPKGRFVTRALMGLGAAAGLAGVFLGARHARAARGTPDESSDESR